MTRATRPPDPLSALVVSVSLMVAVMSLILRHSWSLVAGGRVGERVDATDDLADLLGNTGLAGLVGDSGVLLDELGGVVGRGLHRALAGGPARGGRPAGRRREPRTGRGREEPPPGPRPGP